MTPVLALVWALGAPNPDARAAEEAFDRGDYAAALEALERAYATEPDPRFLFAEGSTLQRLGRHQDAIEAYERFLATGPERELAQKAYARIQECRAALEDPPPASPPAPIAPAPEDPVAGDTGPTGPSGPTRDEEPRPWSKDPVGGVLLASGVALGTAGAVFIAVGARRRDEADTRATEAGFRDALRSSNVLQGVGIGVAVGGGLLLTGAVLRYWKVSRVEPTADGLAVRF